MRTPPTNWALLMSQKHDVETKAIIGEDTYYGFDGTEGIWSCTTSPELFETLSVGNCCSSTITIVLVNPRTIARMASIKMYVRLTNGTITTDWVAKGVYYIDTREWDTQHEFLTITGYDAMLMLEQPYLSLGSMPTWPEGGKLDTAVVAEICARVNLQLDPRTQMNKHYRVLMPGIVATKEEGGDPQTTDSDSLREVLGWIGAMYGGNWCITDEGKLHLVPLVAPISTGYLIEDAGYAITFGGDRILV